MKKVICVVTAVIALLLISAVLGIIWISQRAEQVSESKKDAFLKNYGSCIEQIEADYPQLEFVSANYNGMECASFYCNEDISVSEQAIMTYEIFDIIRRKSYEIYGSDTDEAVRVSIVSSDGDCFKFDNMDLDLRIFTNCDVNENEIKEIIPEDFKLIKESEQ